MAIKDTDISFVLSGGINNDDPRFSLGGFPSPTQMPRTINNLFSNITPNEASVGKTDYKCFYIFNDNSEYSMYECRMFLDPIFPEADTPASVLVGMLFRDEIQTISITPLEASSLPPDDSGSFRLKIDDLETELITWTSDANDLASNMETAFKAIMEDDVTIEYAGLVGDATTFTVTFYGINQNKAFGVIEVSDNSAVPAQAVTAEKVVIGSPINTVATDIGV